MSTESRNFTLTEYLLTKQSQFPHATVRLCGCVWCHSLTFVWLRYPLHLAPQKQGKFTRLLNALEIASKYVSSKVRAAGLLALFGEEGSTNVQGEIVKKVRKGKRCKTFLSVV